MLTRFAPYMEALIRALGYTSSVVVLLIVFFLFREGFMLFTQPPLSDEMKAAVTQNNPVRELSTSQIRALHEEEITNWSEVGGPDLPVKLLNPNNFAREFPDVEFDRNKLNQQLPQLIEQLAETTPGLFAVFPESILPKNLVPVDVGSISLSRMLSNPDWQPTKSPTPSFGLLAIIVGTFLVTLIAILIALPLGLAVAIYLAELAGDKLTQVLKPLVELLAGIPSVVYGFFGLVVLVPLIQDTFDLDTGKSALAGGILLAIIALPTIITIAEDAIRSTPKALREASFGLGATHWQTITRVSLPYAFPGIAAATILGVGRAVGETMAVLMVTGNSAILPDALTDPVRTLSATIAAELGEAPQSGLHYQALFVVGAVLFIITFFFNLVASSLAKRQTR